MKTEIFIHIGMSNQFNITEGKTSLKLQVPRNEANTF